MFSNLRNTGEDTLIAMWLRSHIFVYGLFGQEQRGGDGWFLSEAETKEIARDMSATWRQKHMQGELLPCRWDLQPVFTMIDNETWDDECRKKLDDALKDVRALDGFSLMLFGGAYTVDQSTVAKMCSYEAYIQAAKRRLADEDSVAPDATVLTALRKAARGGWL